MSISAYNTGASGAFRLFVWLSIAGAALCLVLLAVRSYFAISFSEPMQVHTTGDEFSQFYAIWRQIQGLPVYTDRFSPPYYFAIYNWLFYESYGAFTGIVLDILSLEDAWVPTVARFFSLISMALGIAASYVVFKQAADARNGAAIALCGAFAVFTIAGPLVGYWNITVRSDLWSRTFEVIGIALFLTHYEKKRWIAVITLILCSYLAWAFKQSGVFSAGAVGLFLLLRRDWWPMLTIGAILPAMWAVTFYIGTPQYVENILLTDYPISFTIDRLIRNLLNFTYKSGPILFFLTALFVLLLRSRIKFEEMWKNNYCLVGLTGTFVSALITIPSSAQTGGAENYFFVLSFFMTLWVISVLPIVLRSQGWPVKFTLAMVNTGWMTLSLAIVLVLFGVIGVIDVRGQHTQYMAGKHCLDSLKRPLYVNNPYLSLPWMTPNNESYVLFYEYHLARMARQIFKEDGIGGMISKGKFASLAISADTLPQTVDGASLNKYKIAAHRCSNLHLFSHK
jgi:hypothetical protein